MSSIWFGFSCCNYGSRPSYCSAYLSHYSFRKLSTRRQTRPASGGRDFLLKSKTIPRCPSQ